MSATLDLPRTAARSTQLVKASERSTHDPFEEIDWDGLPVDDSAFHLPPELLSLYGTTAWDEMTEPERIAYSRHETVALLGAGIWFENALMQIVLRHLVDIPVTDPMHRYLLVEVADECRHSTTVREAAPVLVNEIVALSLNPDVFEQLGIDGGLMIAASNPHYR
ncbi:MAG: diiron oxygenase, partial [Acidimicrobiia bacterium]|nr:diiron oxygenase [Acidimicrobiia bacterium]